MDPESEAEVVDRLIKLEQMVARLLAENAELRRTVSKGLHADSAGYVHISYGYDFTRDLA
jgi:hypothetical protein